MNRGKLSLALVVALLLPALAAAQTPTKPKAAAAGKTLKVKLNYTGSGVVDEKHKIYVLICDADPFAAERLEDYTGKPVPKPEPGSAGQKIARILQRQGTASKDSTLVFIKLPVSPVYAVAFYDHSGTYQGHSDPSAGSPMGLYGSQPGQPEPIKVVPGKPTRVTVSFDDSAKTP